MAPRSILLATDLSCRCDRAFDRAAMLAAEWHARLVVLHVLEEPAAVTSLPSWRRPPDPREAAREQVYKDLQGLQGIDLDVVVERGEPAERILEVASQNGCELIVTGMARYETLGRIRLGTTVDRLVRTASVPILVVKERPRRPYRNVVVATDFSEGSRCALETALALLPDAEITLFHAFDVAYESFIDDKMAAREAAERTARDECEKFLAATPAAAGRAITMLCEYGEPGALLQDLARARDVDLVVLGTEGRSALARLFLGSIAERLLTRLPVDALVVRRRRR